MARNSLEDELKPTLDEMIEQDKKRSKIAFEKIKKQVINKIYNIIVEDMVNNYYDGYDPLVYVRSRQLSKSIAPLIIDESNGEIMQFSFGIQRSSPYGPEAMKHDVLTISKTNKRGETKIYSYAVPDYNPSIETFIFNNFMEGHHPNANSKGFTATPTTNVDEAANKALDKLISDGIVDKIIQEVFA